MKLLKLSLLLGIMALPASATNFSGKWVIQVSGPSRGGPMPRITLILNQVGNEVEGAISSRIDASTGSPANVEILDGKVEGDTLTFYVWTGRDRPVKAYYKGVLSGEEIKFTVTGGADGPGGGARQGDPRQLTAKRAK